MNYSIKYRVRRSARTIPTGAGSNNGLSLSPDLAPPIAISLSLIAFSIASDVLYVSKDMTSWLSVEEEVVVVVVVVVVVRGVLAKVVRVVVEVAAAVAVIWSQSIDVMISYLLLTLFNEILKALCQTLESNENSKDNSHSIMW